MFRIGSTVAAVMAGVASYWLCVPAQTPGIERAACCSTVDWALMGNTEATAPATRAAVATETALLTRAGTPHGWAVHIGAGPPVLRFQASAPADRLLSRVFPAPAGPMAATGASGLAGYPGVEGDGGGFGAPFIFDWIDFHIWGGKGRWRYCHTHPHCHHHPGGGGGPPPTAVPEPGVWALLIVGITLLGAASRRRRARAADAFRSA